MSEAEQELRCWNMLNEACKGDVAVKINTLLNTMENYAFSENQLKRLTYLPDAVKNILSQYKGNTYLSKIPIVNKAIGYIAQRAHADIADDLLTYIKTVNNPNELLRYMFATRLLLSGRNSNEL